MRKSKPIQFQGKEYTAQELTVQQVDALFTQQRKNGAVSTAEMLLDPSIPIDVVIASTGITAEQLNGDVTPGELRAVWDAVEEVNPFLSQMYGRLIAAVQVMEKEHPES